MKTNSFCMQSHVHTHSHCNSFLNIHSYRTQYSRTQTHPSKLPSQQAEVPTPRTIYWGKFQYLTVCFFLLQNLTVFHFHFSLHILPQVLPLLASNILICFFCVNKRLLLSNFSKLSVAMEVKGSTEDWTAGLAHGLEYVSARQMQSCEFAWNMKIPNLLSATRITSYTPSPTVWNHEILVHQDKFITTGK